MTGVGQQAPPLPDPALLADVERLHRQFGPVIAAEVLRRMARAGDIGEGQREYEFEPITEPGVPEPIHVPTSPQREPEKVPA